MTNNNLPETPRDRHLSGNTYVRAYLDGAPTQLVISSARRCNHLNRICEACADRWAWDYCITYDSTNGGRALLERIEERIDARVDAHIEAGTSGTG